MVPNVNQWLSGKYQETTTNDGKELPLKPGYFPVAKSFENIYLSTYHSFKKHQAIRIPRCTMVYHQVPPPFSAAGVATWFAPTIQ